MTEQRQPRRALQVGAAFLLLNLAAGLAISNARSELEEAQLSNRRVAQDVSRLEERAAQRDKLVRKLEELRQAVREYVKILPSAELATEEQLQRLISQRATRAGITILELKVVPAARPRSRNKKDRAAEPFKEVELSLSLEGGFTPFVTFLNLLEKDERFLKVTYFRLAEPDSRGLIKVELEVSSFSYTVA